jgi:hypothetical protein
MLEVLTYAHGMIARVGGDIALRLAGRRGVTAAMIVSWADELEKASVELRALAKEHGRGGN